MAEHATYDDVNLILKLYELRRETKLREARVWFGTFKARTMEEFNAACPPGSENNAYFRMVTSYWEMVASFVTGGVLNADLFYESGRELLFVWEKIRDLVPIFREAFKNPVLQKNMEAVAKLTIDKMNQESPDAYAAFSTRVRGM